MLCQLSTRWMQLLAGKTNIRTQGYSQTAASSYQRTEFRAHIQFDEEHLTLLTQPWGRGQEQDYVCSCHMLPQLLLRRSIPELPHRCRGDVPHTHSICRGGDSHTYMGMALYYCSSYYSPYSFETHNKSVIFSLIAENSLFTLCLYQSWWNIIAVVSGLYFSPFHSKHLSACLIPLHTVVLKLLLTGMKS